jgi:hypothetical protein
MINRRKVRTYDVMFPLTLSCLFDYLKTWLTFNTVYIFH